MPVVRRGRTRDAKRQAVYEAEWAAHDAWTTDCRWATETQLLGAVKSIVETSLYRDLWYAGNGVKVESKRVYGKEAIQLAQSLDLEVTPPRVIFLRSHATWAWGSSFRNYIKLGVKCFLLRMVLHELSHVCVREQAGFQAHGREWRWIHLQLIERFMGKEAMKILKSQYKLRKLKTTLPRKITEEHKVALRANMLKARAVRNEKIAAGRVE